jgi:hypothetical protein
MITPQIKKGKKRKQKKQEERKKEKSQTAIKALENHVYTWLRRPTIECRRK